MRRSFSKLWPKLWPANGVPGISSQERSADVSASLHRSSRPNTLDSQVRTQFCDDWKERARSIQSCARENSRREAQVTACEASQLACVSASAPGISGFVSQV